MNNQHTHTSPPWVLCMDDLTIRAVGSNGRSDCMGDYRGSIIADLKPSLGVEDEDVQAGALDITMPSSYPNGGGARSHAWEEVIANGRAIVSRINSSQPPVRDEGNIPQLLEEAMDGCQEVLDNLSAIDYQDERHTAEQIGIAKHLLTKLLGTIESYK